MPRFRTEFRLPSARWPRATELAFQRLVEKSAYAGRQPGAASEILDGLGLQVGVPLANEAMPSTWTAEALITTDGPCCSMPVCWRRTTA